MDVLWEIVVTVGHVIEQVLAYVETHHWIFGFLVVGYIVSPSSIDGLAALGSCNFIRKLWSRTTRIRIQNSGTTGWRPSRAAARLARRRQF